MPSTALAEICSCNRYCNMAKQEKMIRPSEAPLHHRHNDIPGYDDKGRLAYPLETPAIFGLLIRPKPASSRNMSRTFPQGCRPVENFNSLYRLLIFLRLQSPRRLLFGDAWSAALFSSIHGVSVLCRFVPSQCHVHTFSRRRLLYC